jgi:hypothetical protein
MFDIGLKDTITVKKPATTGRTSGTKTVEWDEIIEDQKCRKVETRKVETDESGAQILIKEETILVNYSGSEIDETCIAIVNGVMYEIKEATPAEGFGRNFISIKLKARK